MEKKLKKIPKFGSEKEERKFWEENDSTEYIDWDRGDFATFANLKKTTKTISIRLPQDMIDKLKVKANKMDIGYQSLIKVILQEALDRDNIHS